MKCKCTHSKSQHVGDFDYDVCCAVWLSRKDGFVNMCDCREFEELSKNK